MSRLTRYTMLGVAGVALLLVGCESMALDPEFDSGLNQGEKDDIPNYGVKPTVPLKRRPIVPTHKLPRPRIIERISWTEAGTLSVALTENAPVVVTLVERDGTMRGYVVDGRSVEIVDVPTEAFELQIDVDGECYSVMVE